MVRRTHKRNVRKTQKRNVRKTQKSNVRRTQKRNVRKTQKRNVRRTQKRKNLMRKGKRGGGEEDEEVRKIVIEGILRKEYPTNGKWFHEMPLIKGIPWQQRRAKRKTQLYRMDNQELEKLLLGPTVAQ
jgi:hypothetical protein